MKNWYLCLQFAHAINQLAILSETINNLLTNDKITEKHLWKLLKGTIIFIELTDNEIFNSSEIKIQIRLR